MPEDLLYQRQRDLHLNIPNSVTVVGCGGIGSWVAILSAMSGINNIYLFDPDIVEEHNRNRLPFCQSSLNQAKVDIVKNYILGIRPDTIVVAIKEKLEGVLLDIQLHVSSFVIDCTDSPKSQLIIYNACKKTITKFIRAGYDGTHITITSNVSGWIKATEEETYTINPSWVVPTVIVAALAVGKMEKFTSQETSLDISEIGIPVLTRRRKSLTTSCLPE